MTKGPKGEKRPADINQLAFRIMSIATGSQSDPLPVSYRREAGLKGAKSRMKSLSSKKRSKIARKASKSRWSKKKS